MESGECGEIGVWREWRVEREEATREEDTGLSIRYNVVLCRVREEDAGLNDQVVLAWGKGSRCVCVCGVYFNVV